MAAARPTWLSEISSPDPFSVRREEIVPTIVTSRPSRIHTVPSPTSTIQCQRDPGSRSSRAGIRVSTILPVAIESVAISASAVGCEREDPPRAEVENARSRRRSGLGAADLALDVAGVARVQRHDPAVAHLAHDADARVQRLVPAVADELDQAGDARRVGVDLLDERLETVVGLGHLAVPLADAVVAAELHAREEQTVQRVHHDVGLDAVEDGLEIARRPRLVEAAERREV